MSVIHEAIKRARQARQARQEKNPPAAPSRAPDLTVRSAVRRPVWPWWVMSFFVFVSCALAWREHRLRLKSENKMRAAYLELNDVRGDFLETKKNKTEAEVRYASEINEMGQKLNDALKVKTELIHAKQAVEFDNLDKEKKLSLLTKKAHETEMDKFRLQDEVKALRAELSSRPAPEPVSKSS